MKIFVWDREEKRDLDVSEYLVDGNGNVYLIEPSRTLTFAEQERYIVTTKS